MAQLERLPSASTGESPRINVATPHGDSFSLADSELARLSRRSSASSIFSDSHARTASMASSVNRTSSWNRAQTERVENSKPLVQGWVEKKKGGSKSMKRIKLWHQRYFVLSVSDSFLYFYLNKRDSLSLVYNTRIPFEDITRVTLHPSSLKDGCRFDIGAKKKEYCFKAPTAQKALYWVYHMKETFAECAKQSCTIFVP